MKFWANILCITRTDFLEFVTARFNLTLAFCLSSYWLKLTKNKNLYSLQYVFSAHCSIGLSVHQWSGRPGFNPRSRHTKNFKNGT